jgi:DNA-binding CsgD family transcriptional regulator
MLLSALGLPAMTLGGSGSRAKISLRGETVIIAAFAVAWVAGDVISARIGEMIAPWDVIVSVIAYVAAVASAVDLFGRIIPREREERGSQEAVLAAAQDLARRGTLTPREQEVLVILVRGRTLAHMQKALNISEGTAKTHVNHIYQKLGIHSREELLDLAFPEGEPAR